jgi:hypothetical protein
MYWKFNAKVRSLKFIYALCKTSVPTPQKKNTFSLGNRFLFLKIMTPFYKIPGGKAACYP